VIQKQLVASLGAIQKCIKENFGGGEVLLAVTNCTLNENVTNLSIRNYFRVEDLAFP
jgi:hypothetical protein